jgi:hypothetical protein
MELAFMNLLLGYFLFEIRLRVGKADGWLVVQTEKLLLLCRIWKDFVRPWHARGLRWTAGSGVPDRADCGGCWLGLAFRIWGVLQRAPSARGAARLAGSSRVIAGPS